MSEAAAMVAAEAIPVLAALIGEAWAAGDHERVRALREQAVREFGDDILPELDRLQAEQVGESEFARINEDPRAREAQYLALRRMQEEVESGGMTPEDRAAYAEAEQQAAGFERGMRGANQARLAARGMSGSGLEAASVLGGQQEGIARQSQAGLNIAAEARRRALASLGQLGDFSTGLRGQEYDMASQRARAQDALNQFNARMRADTARFNAGQKQQEFENLMGVKRSRNVAREGLVEDYESAAQRKRRVTAGIGQAGKGAAKQYGGGS